jgi:hypothetical protein
VLRCGAVSRLCASICFVWLAVAGVACDRTPKVGFGEPCESDAACTTGMCVGDGTSRHRGRCTKSCGPDTSCPEGWSCSALTARGVAVCAQGSGIPELDVARTRR